MLYIYIEEHTRICLLRNHSLWGGRMTEFCVRAIMNAGWKFSKHKGGAGWKL